MSYLPHIATLVFVAFLFYRAVWIEAIHSAYADACNSKEFGKRMNPYAIWSRGKMLFHFWEWEESVLIPEDESRKLFGDFIDKALKEMEKDSSD